jgi:DNA topoisomerase VI subunit B
MTPGIAMDNHTLPRSTFATSRLAEFASVKELTTQTGHGPEDWALVIVKELADNGIDAAEMAGKPPVIAITVAGNSITVTDNGGGISPDDVVRILDFSQRVSTNEAYASPTRGRQGNAIQTVLAMPFVLDPSDDRGGTTIESRGVKHTVGFEVDPVRRTPKVSHTQGRGFVHSGTRVSVRWPFSACSNLADAKAGIVQIAENYAALNPHLSISVQWNSRNEVNIKAADPAWIKWLPSDPISAQWYDTERFERLITAIVANDQDNGRETLVREFVATFRGMARSDIQKQVLDRTGAARMSLAGLFAEGNNREAVTALRHALQDITKPVKPIDLGVIGRDHLEKVCLEAGGDPETFGYHKVIGTTNGLPWIIEVAFAYCPEGDDSRIIAGCNWSPGIVNPFHDVDAVLANQYVEGDTPVVIVIHLVCPVLAFADRGKSQLVLPSEIEEAVKAAVIKATTPWARQAKAEIRDTSAKYRRLERLQRLRKVSIKDAVYSEIAAAYRKASNNGKLPANARQVMYAMRQAVLKKIGKAALNDQYVTQTLIPDYIAEHPEQCKDWDIAYDDRGHLVEPHTEKTVGLGTLSVREYLAEHGSPQVLDSELEDAHVETVGPAGNFGALLYVEKEGFDALIESANLRERFDIATMSCKGMSVTAARSLVEAICQKRGIQLYVLHDFDKSGLSIKATLTESNRRYQFEHKVEVNDIGLRWADIDDQELWDFAEPHSDRGTEWKRTRNMHQNSATKQEIEFLLHKRIELNAMTSRQFLDFIERKLIAAGVKKIVPGDRLLRETYRAIVRGDLIREAFEDARAEVEEETETVVIHANLKAEVEALLKKEPTLRWDAAVARIARIDSAASAPRTRPAKAARLAKAAAQRAPDKTKKRATRTYPKKQS